jgi:hypothetical protein
MGEQFNASPARRAVRGASCKGEMTMFKLTTTLIMLSAMATSAWAGPSCKVPREKWLSEADFKAKVEAQGYQIKTFKVTKGECYEIYGFDKSGKKVEIYFDPATAAILEQK